MKISHIRVEKAAQILGVSSKTLRRWDMAGKLVPQRSEGGHRFYTYEQLRSFSSSNSKHVSAPVQPKIHVIPDLIGKLYKFIIDSRLRENDSLALRFFVVWFILGLTATVTLARVSPSNLQQLRNSKLEIRNSGEAVLGVSAPAVLDYLFNINVPSNLKDTVDFKDIVEFAKDIEAPNIIHSLKEGDGIDITTGQTPTISNTGALSINSTTGAVTLTAGSGISISGLTITNSDTGSAQNIFKNIAVTGQTTITAGSNSSTLNFAEGLGIVLTTDATGKIVTIGANGEALNVSGWTRSGSTIYNTTLTDLVGIGTATPSANLDVIGTAHATGAVTLGSTLEILGTTTLLGNLNVNGNLTFGNAATDTINIVGRLADNSTILPANDLGADLGTALLRFNNLYVANLNSNNGLSTEGQAVFTYSPVNTDYTGASVIVNPTSPVANAYLLGVGVNDYQRAGIDAEGDLSVGYNGLANLPTSTNPLTIYGNGSTALTTISTSGNLVTQGNLDVNGTTNDIGGTLNLSGNALTSSGTLNITPNAGSNLNVALSAGGQFAVNNNLLAVNSTNGFIGIGNTSPTANLDIASTAGTDAIRYTSGGNRVLGLSYGSNGAGIDLVSTDPANKAVNGNFETDLSSWTGTQNYTLDDEFSDTLPATMGADTFTRTDGAIGTAETGGAWTGSTWTILNGKAINSPPATGGEILANPGLEEPYSNGLANGWTAVSSPTLSESSDVHGGAAAQQFTGTADRSRIEEYISPSVGTWYVGSVWAKRTTGTGSNVNFSINSNPYYPSSDFITSGTYSNYVITSRSRAAGQYFRPADAHGAGTSDTVIVDDASLKTLSLPTLFAVVSSSASTDLIIQDDVVVSKGTQAGVVMNLDSESAPSNFVIAYIDGYTASLEKSVGGTYTSVIAAASITYVPGATLKVIKNGTSYSLFYNGAQVGTTQTISDAGIVSNTKHGLFSTYSGNTLDNFSVKSGVNDTLATDGVNTRTVGDTLGKFSMGSGLITMTPSSVNYGDPGIRYASGINRAPGTLFVTSFRKPAGTGYAFPLGLATSATGNFGSFNNLAYGFYNNNGSSMMAPSNAAAGPEIFTVSNDTQYKLALSLKSTGAYYYIKGGIYTNWSLAWISYLNSTATLYPAISNYSETFSSDYIHSPTTTFIPTPIAYDSFNRADGAIGTSDTSGPDGQTTPGLSWTGSTWTVATTGGDTATGKAVNTPTVGSDILTDGDLEGNYTNGKNDNLSANGSPTSSQSADAQSGTKAQQFTADVNGAYLYWTSPAPTSGKWYSFSSWAKRTAGTSNGLKPMLWQSGGLQVDGTAITSATYAQKTITTRAIGTNTFRVAAARENDSGHDTVIFDAGLLKPLTTSELISSVTTSTSDVVATADVTLSAGTQAGLVLNLDNAADPKNFILVYLTGTQLLFDKVVNGVYTNVSNTTNYSTSGTFQVIKDGDSYRVYFNGSLLGNQAYTISDHNNNDSNQSHISTNTKHGLFSTYSGNTLDNFTLFPRGTNGEFNAIPAEDLTVTRDTSTTYASSVASAKLVAGGNDANFLQSINVGDTQNYNITTFVRTDGSTVTSNDLSLYYDTGTITTTYTPIGANGWYKLTGTITGVNAAKNFGVRVKAGKTVYLDNLSVSVGTGGTNTFYVQSLGAGLAGIDIQTTSTLHTGVAGNKGLIVVGGTNWETSTGSVLSAMTSAGQLGLGTSNLEGAELKVSGNTIINSTSGDILTASSSGTMKLTVDSSGNIISAAGASWKSMTDTTTALAITNAAGTSLVNFDTTNTNTTINAVSMKNALTLKQGATNLLALATDANGSLILDSATTGTNKLLNTGFESDLTSWSGTQAYTLDDEFTTSASPTTLVSGGLSAPNPTIGNEMVANGTFDTDTGWTKGADWTISGNAAASSGVTNLTQNVSPVANNWYQILVTDSNWSVGSLGVGIGSLNFGGYLINSSYHNNSNVFIGRANGDPLTFRVYTNYTGTIDDVSVKPLTLSSLFSTTTEATANKTISANATLTKGTQAGVVVNLDNATTPNNFVIAYHDGTNAHLDKNVGGTYTSLINQAAAYSAGAQIAVIKTGSTYRLVYNGAAVGAPQTISDAGIVNNTLQGLFSTYASNSFTNFTIFTNIDGTLAEPTGGSRTVFDPNAKLTISGGKLNVPTGITADNSVKYSNFARGLGKVMYGNVNLNAGSGQVWFGQYGQTAFTITDILLGAYDGTAGVSLAPLVAGTDYKLAIAYKNSGAYMYVKGGVYTNWTLAYIASTDTTANVTPGITAHGATSVFTAENIKVPTATYTPTPLAYDAFNRSDGALGTSDTSGPDAQTTPGLSWTGSTWSITSPNLIINSGFETAGAGGADVFGTWSEAAGDGAVENETSIVNAGTHAAKITTGPTLSTYIVQTITVTPGSNYTLTLYSRGDGTNAGLYGVYDATHSSYIITPTSTNISGTTYGQFTTTFTAPAGCTSVYLYLKGANTNAAYAYFDDVSIRLTSGSVAINTPTVGDDTITNGGFANWTGDNPDGWTANGETGADNEISEVGTGESHGGTGTGFANIYSTTQSGSLPRIEQAASAANQWYLVTVDVNKITSGNELRAGDIVGNDMIRAISTGTKSSTLFNSNGTWSIWGTGLPKDMTIDNFTAKPLVTSSLFSTVSTSTSDVIADVTISSLVYDTYLTHTAAGLVLGLDSASNPQNYIVIYETGYRLFVDQIVNGARTSHTQMGADGLALGAGQLRAIKDGTKLRVYLNNAMAGSELTLTANTNTRHGIFSTDAGNRLDNFTLFPRGTSGEYTGLPAEDLTVTRDATKSHKGTTASAKLVAAGNDANFLQTANVGDTNTYTLTAYAYTNGSPVTAGDVALYYDTAAITTNFAPAGAGWYKLTGTLTGADADKSFGVRVKAGKTVYVDDMYLETGGVAQTLYLTDTGSGAAGLDVQTTATLHSAGTANQALIIKAMSGQTGNLAQWLNGAGITLGLVTGTGIVEATSGVATFAKAGVISDSDFTNPVNGQLAVDSADERLYMRYGGAWGYVAKSGGFQIPVEEATSFDIGDYLIPYVDSSMSDGAVHGLYTKWSDVKDGLYASESAQIASIEAQLAINDSQLSNIPELTVLGLSTLGDTNINKFTVGNLQLTNGTISSNENIKLQPLALDSILFTDGAIEIDKEGNLLINDGILQGNAQMRGSATLPAGSDFVIVTKAWDKVPKAIVVTPRFEGNAYVDNISNNGFEIHSGSATDSNERIDWVAIW